MNGKNLIITLLFFLLSFTLTFAQVDDAIMDMAEDAERAAMDRLDETMCLIKTLHPDCSYVVSPTYLGNISWVYRMKDHDIQEKYINAFASTVSLLCSHYSDWSLFIGSRDASEGSFSEVDDNKAPLQIIYEDRKKILEARPGSIGITKEEIKAFFASLVQELSSN
ncbi:MAG: hypothetical protein ABIA04_09585 [Pseudomonadota bacterium]